MLIYTAIDRYIINIQNDIDEGDIEDVDGLAKIDDLKAIQQLLLS